MLKNILATLAGILVGVAIVALIEGASHLVFMPPVGVDVAHPETIREAIKNMPVGAFLLVLFAWIAGSFVGAAIATFLSGRTTPVPGLIVGVFILAGTAFTLYFIPHPAWMAFAGILTPLPAAWAGIKYVGA